MSNPTASRVRLERLQVSDPTRRGVLAAYAGGALESVMVGESGTPTSTIEPDRGGLLVLDVALEPGRRVPARLSHRLVLSLTRQGTRSPRTRVARVRTRVDQRAPLRLSPPLRGPNLAVIGRCQRPFAHRLAVAERDGRPVIAQRYAIDFVRLDAGIDSFAGDPALNASHFVYGNEILAAAAGRVVSTRDGVAENTPPAFPSDVGPNDLTGNNVVQDLGEGRFALYAHMQPGSVRVKPGERVERGQLLGLVGNTGNSSAPHLHFHVMDGPGGPSGLAAEGVPYVFDSLKLTDRVTGLAEDPPAPLRVPESPPLERGGQYPFTGDVIEP